MKNKSASPSIPPGIKHHKLFAFLKTIVFFIASAGIIAFLSFLVVYPLWSFTLFNADLFALCTLIVILVFMSIFFIFRLIRSIKEIRADEFFKRLFHLVNFLIQCVVHIFIGLLFAFLFSHSEIPDISMDIFFFGGLCFEAGMLFSLFTAHRCTLLKNGTFGVFTVLLGIHALYWVFGFLFSGNMPWLAFQSVFVVSVGAVIYVRYRSSDKKKAPVPAV
ncbi:MAG: hypothetical protein JW904_07050 [Spirochaetales bacterium]|nr:hypothetical protein [Spirochaetales bacterium]